MVHSRSYYLRDLPDDVYEKILKIQKESKENCNCMVSIERTIYKIIRSYEPQEKK